MVKGQDSCSLIGAALQVVFVTSQLLVDNLAVVNQVASHNQPFTSHVDYFVIRGHRCC